MLSALATFRILFSNANPTWSTRTLRSGLVEGFALLKSDAPTVRISNLLYPVPLLVKDILLIDVTVWS